MIDTGGEDVAALTGGNVGSDEVGGAEGLSVGSDEVGGADGLSVGIVKGVNVGVTPLIGCPCAASVPATPVAIASLVATGVLKTSHAKMPRSVRTNDRPDSRCFIESPCSFQLVRRSALRRDR